MWVNGVERVRQMHWLHHKLLLVCLLLFDHAWCWRLMMVFRCDQNRRSHIGYRWFNEFLLLLLISIILLVILKPFLS